MVDKEKKFEKYKLRVELSKVVCESQEVKYK